MRCDASFTLNETAELLFATILLASMFVLSYQWNFFIAFLIGAFGLSIHELGHKIVGMWRCIEGVEFRTSTTGIGIGFLSSILVGHALAAPGAVTVGEEAKTRDKLIMALAGPMTNIVAFVGFVVLHLVFPIDVGMEVGFQSEKTHFSLWLAAAFVNLYLALFNLVPIPMFDGSHILRYDWVVWIISFISVLMIVIVSWEAVITTLGPLFRGTWGGIFSIVADGDYSDLLLPVIPGLMIGYQIRQ